MSITLAQLIVWLIIGAIAGWLVGTVVPDKWVGLDRWTGLGVGLVGALIGGLIFSFFGIWLGLEAISLSLRDIVAAFIGSLIFLLLLWILRASRSDSR
jgi:uncharacterized membrane protein YeaQ/YmgE (transglycosylase-associated protein family)